MTAFHWMLDKLSLTKEQMAEVADVAGQRNVSIASCISEAVLLWLETTKEPVEA
jgi:hypothetical protein